MNLGVITIKGYSTYQIAPYIDHHRQVQFSIIRSPWFVKDFTLLQRILSSVDKAEEIGVLLESIR